MIHVSHETDAGEAKGLSRDGFFLLLNEAGDYASFPSIAPSRYHGFVICERGRYYKIIDSLGIRERGEIHAIRCSSERIIQERGTNRESIILEKGHGFSLSVQSAVTLEPTFDVRGLFEHPEEGREHNIIIFPDHVLVRAAVENTVFFIACVSNGAFEERNQWRFTTYLYDQNRNSPPFHRYVFAPFEGKGSHFGFGVATDATDAYRIARSAFNRRMALPRRSDRHFAIRENHHLPRETAVARESAMHSLFSLHVPGEGVRGMRAGMPWFPEFWTRDALIALSSFPEDVRRTTVEYFWHEVLERYPLPAHPGADIESADALGWLVVRTEELPEKARKNIERRFTHLLTLLVDGMLQNGATRDGLAISNSRATWMDSVDRSGARIEIQALRLRIYRFLHRTTGKARYRFLEDRLRSLVRKQFWTGTYLKDAPHDPTIRPNIYLAAYLYPELLTREEWHRLIKETFPRLFLPWGGFSSVDIRDPRYRAVSTGENAESYHNGDSWWYVNNIAGIVLHRLGRDLFSGEISKILRASTEEILWHGALGHHGELSSAGELSSRGAWAQAWSAGTYLELTQELFPHKN